MAVEDFFDKIVLIVSGLTFIALLLAFLYMVYGEKEEAAPSSAAKLFSSVRDRLLLFLFRFPVML